MRERVLLGFSGGIDSRTAVALLQADGFDVETLTLDMVGDANLLAQARRVASELGVTHHIKDVQVDFSSNIIDYFVGSYLSGLTPAPCTMCNPLIKWKHLVSVADSLGIHHIATGHYFRVESYNNKLYVAKADDSSKDQSYYLWGLSSDVLSRALTPMSNIIKADVKQHISDKRESMGVCFLRGALYRDFLTKYCPEACVEGDIVDSDGNLVGKHDGIAFYTIGQKRGYQCTLPGAVVTGIDARSNRLVVGTNDDLYKHNLIIHQCNIVDCEELLDADDIRVVVRGIGRNPEGFARHITPTADGYHIELENPAWAVALGQPVVLYRDNRVLGGGIIKACY